jgi:predicted DNA-binding protein
MADDSKYPTRIAPYGLRMPPDLKARVQASADEAGRTLHAELIHTLEEKYPPVSPIGDFEFAHANTIEFLQQVKASRQDDPLEVKKIESAIRMVENAMMEVRKAEAVEDRIVGVVQYAKLLSDIMTAADIPEDSIGKP